MALTTTCFRLSCVALIGALLVSGCSNSNDSNVGPAPVVETPTLNTLNDVNPVDDGANGAETEFQDTVAGDQVESTAIGNEPGIESESTQAGDSGSTAESTIQVNFDITVPLYSSNELQVRLEWGDTNTTAAWITDESWALSQTLSANTDNQLIVTFADRNGGITLGRFEESFRTGIGAAENVRISADQFDTASWDNDSDGVSNIDELIAGKNPDGDDAPAPVQASLEIVPDKTFRIHWQNSSGADFYRLLENPDGVSGFNVVSENLEATTQSYDHRVALYKRANAQYIVQACNTSGCTDSEVMAITGTLEQGVGFFKAANAKGGQVDSSHGNPITFGADHFGNSVKLSADGGTMVMAATGEDSGATGINGLQDDNSAEDSGAVYVFVRKDAQWQLEAYIKASNTDEDDHFGSVLALSDDGDTLAVGVPTESSVSVGMDGDQQDNSAYKSGAVYVFVRSNGTWQQQSYIKASNAEERDQFGFSIDISGDGNSLAVGARYEDGTGRSVNSDKNNDGVGNGAVYVFTRSGATWSEQAYLKPSNSDEYDNFGTTVTISGDGKTIAVNSVGEDSIATGINGDENDGSSRTVGAVYVFVLSDETWQQEAYIKGSAYRESYNFGQYSIALNGDGNTLAVGVWTDPNLLPGLDSAQTLGRVGYSGSVYVFTRNNSQWQRQAFLKASNKPYNGLFGSSVSLSSDGNSLAVGSIGESSASIGVNGDQYDVLALYVGAVYVFKRSGEAWQQQAYVKASNTEAYDGFAGSISLSADGNSLAVSAGSERSGATEINGDQSDNSSPGSGAVYLY